MSIVAAMWAPQVVLARVLEPMQAAQSELVALAVVSEELPGRAVRLELALPLAPVVPVASAGPAEPVHGFELPQVRPVPARLQTSEPGLRRLRAWPRRQRPYLAARMTRLKGTQ